MTALDNPTKTTKGFSIEEDEPAPTGTPRPAVGAPVLPATLLAIPAIGATLSATLPAASEPEQRHRRHVACLLLGNGQGFGTYPALVNGAARTDVTGSLPCTNSFQRLPRFHGDILAQATGFGRATGRSVKK